MCLNSFLGFGREHVERHYRKTGQSVYMHLKRHVKEVRTVTTFFFKLIAGLNFFFKFHRNSKSVVVYFILHSKGTCTYWICHTYKHHKGSKRDKVICINHRFKVVQHLLKMETVSYQCFDEELTLCSGFFLFFLYGNRYFASNVT